MRLSKFRPQRQQMWCMAKCGPKRAGGMRRAFRKDTFCYAGGVINEEREKACQCFELVREPLE